jgi:MFS family permease
MLITLYIRKGVEETARFLETKELHAEAKVPLATVLRDHWPAVLRVMGCSLLAVGGSTLSVFLLGYATGTVKVPATQMITVTIVSGAVGLIAQPFWAALSDRVGRRPVFAASMLATGAFWFPFFWIVSGGNFGAILAAACVFGVLGTGANAVGASMYSEMFPTRVRFTGVAVGTQLGFIVAGFAPAIEAAVQGPGKDGWLPVAIFAAATAVVATIAAWSGRETRGAALEEIDGAGAAR